MVRLTFLLAVIGYAGLTLTAILAARGRVPAAFWRITAAIIVAHVVLVWTVRYEWSWPEAVRHGYAGLLIFHGALALVIGSVVWPDRATPLIHATFAIVTLGAVGAVFMDADVAMYRQIVIALAVAGAVGLLHAWYNARAPRVE